MVLSRPRWPACGVSWQSLISRRCMVVALSGMITTRRVGSVKNSPFLVTALAGLDSVKSASASAVRSSKEVERFLDVGVLGDWRD